MWFSPFVDLWLEWPMSLARHWLSRNPAGVDRRGSAAELLWIKVCGLRGWWVKLDER